MDVDADPLTEDQPAAGPPEDGAPAARDVADELAELRLRVAAQDRLVAALLEENEDIHALRRRNAELEQRFADFTALPPVRLALGVRNRLRRLLGRSGAPEGGG